MSPSVKKENPIQKNFSNDEIDVCESFCSSRDIVLHPLLRLPLPPLLPPLRLPRPKIEKMLGS